MANREIRVGLLWHALASDNLGIGALTLAHLAILRRAAAAEGLVPRFVNLTWPDARAPYEAPGDVEAVALRTRHIARPGGPLGRALGRVDIVFDIGGGDSFTDIYGRHRFLTITGAKLRALLAGRPLVLAPQTIGPFERVWARALARGVLGRAALVASRDQPSTRCAAALGTEALEATDVAMALPYEAPPRARGAIRAGVNVSGLLWNGGYTGANQFGLRADYPTLIRGVIADLQAEGAEVHLIGHVQSETNAVEDDQRVAEALAAETGACAGPRFASPGAAKAYIAGMDFFTGARMHATIAAFSAGVPVIPMAYSRKFAGVFGTLGYAHVAECKTEETEALRARIRAGFAHRAALRAEIGSAMAGVATRLDAYERAAGKAMRTALARRVSRAKPVAAPREEQGIGETREI